jgi:hypothetical protein
MTKHICALRRVGLAILTLTLVAGAAVAGAAAEASPPPPQQDAFYSPPANLSSVAPGTVVRSRHVQLAAFAALPQHVQAWQVMYRTTDYRQRPMAAVTTLLKPADATPTAVISYQLAEDASAPQCAPSYELRLGSSPGEVVNQAEMLLIDAAVADGYAVSVPDYEGLRGDFGAPRQPGYAILDGIRASEHFAPLGLPAGRQTPAAAWGYSGGSLVTGWAAQMQATYAPELNIRGMAVGGFATDIQQALQKINKGFGSGLILSALPGVARTSAGLNTALQQHLNAKGKAALADAGAHCEIHNVTRYAFRNVSSYLDESMDQFLQIPAVHDAMVEDSLSGPNPITPMYVYHAVHDELIPIKGVDAIVPKFCAGGDSVRYMRDSVSEHGSLAVAGAPAALAWLGARLRSTSDPTGCTRKTVLSTALTPAGLRQFPSTVRAILTSLAGLPIGPPS